MNLLEILPAFSWDRVFVEPWARHPESFAPIVAMGFLVITACGWVGTFLVWRRMALVGDAISHSILPGIVLAFLFASSRATLPMFVGALLAGLATSLLIDLIHRNSRVKIDAALGIVFSTLFAFGVILLTLFADHVDLDADCVLYGEIAFLPLREPVRIAGLALGPPEVVRMGLVALAVGVLLVVFYKELLLTSFDAGLAASLGINPRIVHYGLMAALSLCVVSAFEAVGAILVIAMLIFPGVTGSLLSDRLGVILALAPLQALLCAFGGLHLALWLNASIAACMVVVAGGIFLVAWVAAPRRGLLRRWSRSRRATAPEPELPAQA